MRRGTPFLAAALLFCGASNTVANPVDAPSPVQSSAQLNVAELARQGTSAEPFREGFMFAAFSVSQETLAAFIAEITSLRGWQHLETRQVNSPLGLYAKSDEMVNSTATQVKIEGKPRAVICLAFCDDVNVYGSRENSQIS